MRVMNPGPGELFDRLAVLSLKIEVGQQKFLNVDDWQQEEYEILVALTGTGCQDDETMALVEQLRAVNKNIWIAIDRQREFLALDLNAQSEAKLREIAHLGLNVMEQNDIRAKLIGEINALHGIKRPEKISSSLGNAKNVS
jgi:hypothetical protein